MPLVHRVLDRLAATTGTPNVRGVNAMARCPAHDDRTPSLSITDAGELALLYCHAGCDVATILARLDLAARGLFDRRNGKADIPVDVYKYVDEYGTIIFEVVRYAGHTFRQRQPDGNGSYIWNLNEYSAAIAALPPSRAARRRTQRPHHLDRRR